MARRKRKSRRVNQNIFSTTADSLGTTLLDLICIIFLGKDPRK